MTVPIAGPIAGPVAARLPAGRAEWLARMILPHEPSLRAWLARQTWKGIDPDDLVQESYAVLAGLATIDHIANPRAYLFRTAHSLALQQVRRARIVSIQAVADIEALDVAGDAPLQDRQLSDRQELQRLADALAALPARCGEAFRLRKVDGLSQREVAQRMGLSESTVEKHMVKALRLLMERLGNGGNADARTSSSGKAGLVASASCKRNGHDIAGD